MAEVNFLTPLVERYRAAAEQRMAEAGRPVSRAVAVPGSQETWDDCRMVWVRVISVTPHYDQRTQNGVGGCGPLDYTVTLGLGAVTCIATIEGEGQDTVEVPSGEQVTADAYEVFDDMAVLQQVILCDEGTRSILAWTPRLQSGGRGGGEWTFTTTMPACGCLPVG